MEPRKGSGRGGAETHGPDERLHRDVAVVLELAQLGERGGVLLGGGVQVGVLEVVAVGQHAQQVPLLLHARRNRRDTLVLQHFAQLLLAHPLHQLEHLVLRHAVHRGQKGSSQAHQRTNGALLRASQTKPLSRSMREESEEQQEE